MTQHDQGLVRCALLAALVVTPAIALAQPAASGEVTFSKDIVPILQRSCQQCHRQGEMAPMSLVTYQEVRPWARSIRNKVVERQMPPWHIDKNIGLQSFKDDTSLSDEEISLVANWVDNGAPRGNPADAPPPVVWPDAGRWQIGEPDLIVQYPTYFVPAEGPDLFGNIYADLDLDSDRYIKAIQTMPVGNGSARVVHHALSFAVDPDEQEMREAGDPDIPAAQFLIEYASGKRSETYPENSGLLLETWRKMRLDYHLHSVGEDVEAVVQVGMVFHPEGHVPEHVRWSKQLVQHVTDLDIPPGKVVRTDGFTYFHKNARITAFQPHMHGLGTYQCLELIYPSTGTPAETELISCAHWDYNWHMVYNYTDDVAPIIPAGTVAHLISYFDNTDANRGNHDARNWTGGGGRTIDEMSFTWLGWYDMTDEQYSEELAERKALQEAAATTNQQQ